VHQPPKHLLTIPGGFSDRPRCNFKITSDRNHKIRLTEHVCDSKKIEGQYQAIGLVTSITNPKSNETLTNQS
jgi:hypothetical protein